MGLSGLARVEGQTPRIATLTNHTLRQAGSWARLTARADYAAQTWSLYLDGTNVAANLGFAAPQQRLTCLSAEGPTAVLDNLTVGYTLPDGITVPGNLYEFPSATTVILIK